ncbi:MAG: hypothetical protein K9G24_06070, partial [Candidatus Nanopelagicales bacterium]|nr:hypothetical protein [Candidatus Nanopelagicales bacterium]MCF8557509.1 hypothetical protein [Candidatus Nanopelagicales bacterium]
KAGSFVNFEARGGIVAVSCSGSGTTYYRRAQVTVGHLPSGTNYVWVFADAEVGPRVGTTPQFNDMGTMISATGTSAGTTLTVADTSAIAAGDQVNGAGIPAGTTVSTVDSSTALTLSAALTSNVSGNVTIYTERIGATSGLQELCDGTTPYIAGATGTSATTGVLTLGDASASPSTARNNAGVYVNGTSASPVSFDIYVPTNGGSSGSTENFIALGIVVDAGGDGVLDDTTGDTAIFTHVVSKPWDSTSDVLLSACSSPSATADPCIDTAATGIFAADGTTRVGTTSQFSAVASLLSATGQGIIDVNLGFTAAQTGGFAIPANSIVKVSISLPTSGTIGGIDFSQLRFNQGSGQTELLVDPRTTSSSSPTNRWDISTVSDRDIVSIAGQARATSAAVSRSSWYADCQLSWSGSTVSTTGCGEGMTSSVSANYMVFTSVPAGVTLAAIDDPVMATIAGGLVSTNAQGMDFGAETMAGTSFQFAVAGPSYNASDASRSSDGFYYVCVPDAFLSGSFSTTAATAASDWVGTRDGSEIATSFSTGTCGTSGGLVAFLDPFGYSAPVFSLRPPTPASGGSSGSSGAPAATTETVVQTTTTPAATTTSTPAAPAAPAAAPVVYPKLATGRTVKPAYLVKLAGFGTKIKRGSSVRITVPKMYRSVCRVKAGKVIAISSGVCGVKVKVIDAKGKVRAKKRVYLTTTI